MFNYKRSSTSTVQYSHPPQVKGWLTKQQDNAPHLIAIVTDTNKFIIHEIVTYKWLAMLDWSGARIVVMEPENSMAPYEFRTFNSALSFLDALLLHHFIKTANPCVKSNLRVALSA